MMEISRAVRLTLAVLIGLFCIELKAQDPALLSQAEFVAKIDQLVDAATPGVPRIAEADSVQLRKLFLCLIGLPPRLDELNSYQASSDPQRYMKTVDELMDRPEFVEHWAEKLDVMLMERRPNTHVPQDIWMQWLRGQLSSNRPLNQLLADLLTADGAPGENRAVGRFLLDRTGDPHLITKDVSRIYFGRDIQCSQCHNHPTIDSYLQTDYQGLYGFVAGVHTVEVADGDKKIQMVGEKSISDAPFENVFRKGTMHRVLPSLFGAEELPQPWQIPGEEYHPAENGRPAKPIHSRREQLANAIRSGTLEPFNRNIANRVWGVVFGRGIVEPLDLHHAENPPLSEPLLDAISKQFAASQFDLRSTVRSLVLTNAFRTGELDFGVSASPELIAWLNVSAQQATQARDAADKESALKREARTAQQGEFNKKLSEMADVQKERVDALAAVDSARGACAQTVDALKKVAAEKSTADQALNTAQDKAAKVAAAEESTKAALQAIGQDAELAAAVELLKSRLATAQAAIEPAQKLSAEKHTAWQAASDASLKSKEALLAAQNKATEIDGRYRTFAAAAQHVRQLAEAESTSASNAENAALRLHRLADWQSNTTLRAQHLASLEQRAAELEQHKVTTQNLLVTMQAAQQKLPELTTTAQTMVGEQSTKKQALDELNVKISRLNSAKEALSATSGIVADPTQLAGATQQLDNSLVAVREQLMVAEKLYAAAEATAAQRQNELAQHQQLVAQLQQNLDIANQRTTELSAARDGDAKEVESSVQQLASAASAIGNDMAKRFLSSQLRALTPEQIGWSFLSVNGVYKNYVDKHLAELEKAAPATPEQQQDAAFQKQRRIEAVRKARAELQSNINHFVSLYGAGAGQPQSDFFATPDQALYANNGGAIFSWAAASGENVAGRVVSAPSVAEAASVLYRGVLCREPTAAETTAVAKYLEQSADQKPRLVQEMVWSLMASAEFRFLP